MELSPRQILGTYVIERELGRGGMGAVYLGKHQTLGKLAAIKVLLPELSQRDDLVQRFWAEARAVTAIKHASIIDVYDYGVTGDGRAYIVMEYLEGEMLSARIKARGVLPIPQAVTIARQVAHALSAAQAVGVVHRDLKPENIYLERDPEVAGGERAKLLDFGVAKLVADDATTNKTITGAILGTPSYMSPEQCEGARAVDHRSDLYSLGCVLFQMVSGRLPFESAGIGGVIGMHQHVPAPMLRDRAPHASKRLEAIVARLLAKDPAERFQSGDELAAALADPEAIDVDAAASAPLPRQTVDPEQQTAVSGVVSPNAKTEPAPPPTLRTRRRHVPLLWLGGAAVLAASLGFAIWVLNRSHEGSIDEPPAKVESQLVIEVAPTDAPSAYAVERATRALADMKRQLDDQQWQNVGERATVVRQAVPADHPLAVEATSLLAEHAARAATSMTESVNMIMAREGCGQARDTALLFAKNWGAEVGEPVIALLSTCNDTAMIEINALANAKRFDQAFEKCVQRQPTNPVERTLCATVACVLKKPKPAEDWLRGVDLKISVNAINLCGKYLDEPLKLTDD